MSQTPNVLPYAGGGGPMQCPVCLRPIAKPHVCKTLYGVTVCNKCRNGFANRRQAAFIVDRIILVLLSRAMIFGAVNLFANVGEPVWIVLFSILGWVVFPLVFTMKDAIGGRSPGKMLFGVRVVDAVTREPATPMQSLKRNLILLIPYVGVIGGAVTMMRGQRWGERWAGTIVVWNKYAFREPFAKSGRYCRGCGYDLTGNVSGRCPECGMVRVEDGSVPRPPEIAREPSVAN